MYCGAERILGDWIPSGLCLGLCITILPAAAEISEALWRQMLSAESLSFANGVGLSVDYLAAHFILFCWRPIHLTSREASRADYNVIPFQVMFCPYTIGGWDWATIMHLLGYPFLEIWVLLELIGNLSFHFQPLWPVPYFQVCRSNIGRQIPLIIQYFILQTFGEEMEKSMLQLLQDTNKCNWFLDEQCDTREKKKFLKRRLLRLDEARHKLAKFSD